MDSVLIVSSSEKGRSYFTELLNSCSFSQITTLKNGGEARRAMIETEYELVLINTPLSDEFGHELAQMISQTTTSGIILVVKSDYEDEVSEKVEDYGAVVVAKPISRVLFNQSLKLVNASRNRLLGLKSENIKLQQKIEEIRLVDRAKYSLMQYLKLDEAQAHRYIEKQAMDMRTTRAKIAQSILNTYEN